MNLDVYTQDEIKALQSLTDDFGKDFLIDSFKIAAQRVTILLLENFLL
jgi:hypothetical protein